MTREEAIQVISNIIHDDISVYGHKDKPRNIALAMAIEALKEQRPHGKWLVSYKCPNCGEIHNTPFEVCPQCKADMREGDEK